jgi:hypothetical protein
MNSLIVDDRILAALQGAKGVTEIRDANGTTVGFYTPAAIPNAASFAKILGPAGPEELKRRKESNQKGSTTAEVLARLQALEAECARRKSVGEKELTPDEAVAYVQLLRERS